MFQASADLRSVVCLSVYANVDLRRPDASAQLQVLLIFPAVRERKRAKKRQREELKRWRGEFRRR